MNNEITAGTKEKMDKTAAVYNKELSALRVGRANPHVLDRIVVEYYGSHVPIQQLGNIMTPEPKMLAISVWDASAIPAIEKAIQKSDIGINPSNDGKLIRLVFPDLTEERRHELVKAVHHLAEECRVAVRAIRRDANEELKKMEKDGDITEDDLASFEKEIQKHTDDHIRGIDSMMTEKEKEIMEI
ncbi:MAG: ribosome recycling factor [Bacillota bacterium]|nr:ribosome recycling factor [Bacillota bacterium]